MQNVLIHGVSDAGKSMIIEKFLRDHPLESGLETSLRAIVSMQMPPMPTMRSFFSELLRCLDCPVIIGSHISELENDALRQRSSKISQSMSMTAVVHVRKHGRTGNLLSAGYYDGNDIEFAWYALQ